MSDDTDSSRLATRRQRPAQRADADDIAALVRAADRGDHEAWDALVARFGRMIFAVARSVGLSHADACDVCQTTWLRLTQHLGSINDPSRVGAWLATTARREAIRVSQRLQRSSPRDELDAVLPPSYDRLDHSFLFDDRDRTLWQVYSELPERARTLLSLLMSDPPLSYKQLSAITGMPVGSIGPTRARILDSLRASLAERGVTEQDLDEAG
jgi:RNA polymerase sigma factor (sigma-70 family)